MLITHNLKAAWRNILKHKVQNTISVLCLSVGVIFFAITLYFTNVLWGNGKQFFQPDRVHCELYKDNKNLRHFRHIFDKKSRNVTFSPILLQNAKMKQPDIGLGRRTMTPRLRHRRILCLA